MEPDERLNRLRLQRQGLLAKLSACRDFRPGSLVGRYRKCGKPYCHCAKDGSKGHGPCWSLTRAVDGKTVTKIIPASTVDQARAQVSEYHRFQKIVDELVETNISICDTLLELPAGPEAAAAETAAEKGGSRQHSRRQS